MFFCNATEGLRHLCIYINMIITLVLVYINPDHNHWYEYKKGIVTI